MARRSRDARGWRNDLHLRRGVRKILRELDIQPPLDVFELCDRLGELRGKPIQLFDYPLPAPGVFGFWLEGESSDYIIYQRDTTTVHQDHIILHEIGHIISGHGGNGGDLPMMAQLMSRLPPDSLRKGLRREGYDQAIEREAEMVATVIKEWATLLDRLEYGGRRTAIARRVDAAFDDHQGWL
ncbi:hypothetical protein LWC33_29230 [Pseudonocardia sp. RS11V-5]|uniref:hypothetical protein n=1 Tax=Pseudonocardia terrae TaxID=2905831 RepID=UPI001E3F68B2|nr:hypothetical protein [Pseudonocardia terrae]MCE3555516.1 hypothetical protein [Pseudonocardia terrae]